MTFHWSWVRLDHNFCLVVFLMETKRVKIIFFYAAIKDSRKNPILMPKCMARQDIEKRVFHSSFSQLGRKGIPNLISLKNVISKTIIRRHFRPPATYLTFQSVTYQGKLLQIYELFKLSSFLAFHCSALGAKPSCLKHLLILS